MSTNKTTEASVPTENTSLNGFFTGIYNPSTSFGLPEDECSISESIFIFSITILTLELLIGIISNILLVSTICNSPSLKTPPNALLVNICANNLVLCLCMFISLISYILSVSLEPDKLEVFNVLGYLQLFLRVTVFMQYCTIFTSIGYYRCKTVKSPSKSVAWRTRIIMKSIVFGWTISLILATSLTIAYRTENTALSWNPFRKTFDICDIDIDSNLDASQVALLYILLFIVLVLFGIIIKSYYYIIKTLFKANAVCKNKVSPWVKRTSTDSSDGNDLMGTSQRSYKPEESVDMSQAPRSAFVISNGQVLVDNFMVHYQKRNNSISFVDEAFALENPLKAQNGKDYGSNSMTKKKPLSSQLSTISQGSAKSNVRCADFTDISPGAQLHRFQSIKNKLALQNQSLRRDRISLGGATKNSVIMILTFFLCSTPGFICSIPGVLNTDKFTADTLSQTLLMCQLLFYVNAPAYPIWYLVFSKRVRKCLLKLFDTALIRFKIRQ